MMFPFSSVLTHGIGNIVEKWEINFGILKQTAVNEGESGGDDVDKLYSKMNSCASFEDVHIVADYEVNQTDNFSEFHCFSLNCGLQCYLPWAVSACDPNPIV